MQARPSKLGRFEPVGTPLENRVLKGPRAHTQTNSPKPPHGVLIHEAVHEALVEAVPLHPMQHLPELVELRLQQPPLSAMPGRGQRNRFPELQKDDKAIRCCLAGLEG